MSENTPKLDLLMKDPVLDGHEYFNVKTMMNDNWEKIDTFAETVDGEVKELQQRLDTEQRKEITLQPGLQIIESDKTVPFRLTGLKGRTLVNLLGRDGNCENINRFTPTRAVLTADTTVKTQGTQSLKITSTGLPTGAATGQSFSVKAGSYYILVGDVKLGSGTYAGPYVNGISNTKNNGNATDTTNFSTVWRAYSALSNAATVSLVSEVTGPVGSVAYFDSLRFYEITAAEYAALDDMSAEQVGAKYPYVDSIKPVSNPYVTQCGGNLLPSFYEWGYTSASAGKVIAPNILSIDSTIVGPNLNAWVPVRVIKNTQYNLSVSHNGMIGVYDENQTTPLVEYSSAQEVTFNTGSREMIHVFFRAVAINTGSYLFTNPMLNIGNKSLPFTPHEHSILALQTDLYADPLTDANADSVYERGGQYFKSKKWQQIVLDGSLTYARQADRMGYKNVEVSTVTNAPEIATGVTGAKYDGRILVADGTFNVADRAYGTNGKMYITVPAADSGWGDNYPPTADEIKAYFMGWKMYLAGQGDVSIPYNNETAGKAWVPLDGIYRTSGGPAGATFVTSMPTRPITEYSYTRHSVWTPYELVYQLATPTFEPILSEGQLTLNEGSNQVEVGSGIVLRERANPLGNTTFSGFYINNTNQFPGSVLSHRVQKILGVYKNSRKDKWRIVADSNSNGREQAFKSYADFDSSATYSVTYLMQDTSPLSVFVGSLPDNEKSVISDLVQDMQQASTRISIVENKKEDKDKAAPVWITPTLLNSWVDYDTYRKSVGYYKDASGRVHVYGYLKGGISSTGSTVFILPPGFRPTRPIEVSAPSVTPANVTVASTLVIHSQNGNIVCNAGVANGALLLDFSFMTI